jgi:hypothetical protein
VDELEVGAEPPAQLRDVADDPVVGEKPPVLLERVGVLEARLSDGCVTDVGEERVGADLVGPEIAIAKLVTTEANLASALSAVQIFGGRGYMREAGLERSSGPLSGRPYTQAPTRCSASDRVDARPRQAGLEVILRGDR